MGKLFTVYIDYRNRKLYYCEVCDTVFYTRKQILRHIFAVHTTTTSNETPVAISHNLSMFI
ncbi:MAG: hypothetical protein QXI43_00190 [Candidatus Nitrosocaldus sp.]